MNRSEAVMVAHAFEETRHAAVPTPLPLYKLATSLLDAILALTWRLATPPVKIRARDSRNWAGPKEFVCPACGQLWSTPRSILQSFVFRCDCRNRMIVHPRRPSYVSTDGCHDYRSGTQHFDC